MRTLPAEIKLRIAFLILCFCIVCVAAAILWQHGDKLPAAGVFVLFSAFLTLYTGLKRARGA